MTAPRRRHPLRDAVVRSRPHVCPRSLVLALALAGGVGAMSGAHADAGSRNEAIEQALARDGGAGKVLGVREERDERGVVYAVKVLTDGRVRVHRIRGR